MNIQGISWKMVPSNNTTMVISTAIFHHKPVCIRVFMDFRAIFQEIDRSLDTLGIFFSLPCKCWLVNNCCVWPSTCMFELNFITVMFLFGKRCVWILKNHENVKSWIRICILKSLDVFFLPWRDVFWDTDDISVTGPPEVTKSLESLDRALWVQRLKLTEVNLSFFSSSRLNQWVLLDVPLGQRNCRMTESLVVLTLVGGERRSLAPSMDSSISCTSSPSHIKSTKKSIHYSNLDPTRPYG